MNRKLIRPNLTDLKDQMGAEGGARRPKRVPPEQTNAESFYYLKQMNNKTPMVVVLQDGEEIRGIIEWYDKNCLKLNRNDRPEPRCSRSTTSSTSTRSPKRPTLLRSTTTIRPICSPRTSGFSPSTCDRA